MDKESAVQVLEMFLHKQCDLGRTEFAYDANTVWEAVAMATDALKDSEPVKHGKWIDEIFKPWGLVFRPYKCDQCGEHNDCPSNYCPYCGAEMIDEENE